MDNKIGLSQKVVLKKPSTKEGKDGLNKA